jgi:hypothetical protein
VMMVMLHLAFHFRGSAKNIWLGAGLYPVTHGTTSIAVPLFGFTATGSARFKSRQRSVGCVG